MSKPYLLGMYEKAVPATLDWRERLEVAKRCGYDFVEISIDETDERLSRLDWTAEQRRDLVRAQEEAGVAIRSLCLSAHRKYPLGASDPAVRARSLEIAEKAIALAADLGVRIVMLAGYDVYYEEGSDETRAHFAENLAKVTEMAAREGVLLGFETMETPFMDTVEKAMHYVDLIGSPYLNVYPDLGNITNASLIYGKPVSEDVLTGRGHIIATHCKETVAGRYREVPFGTGTTDYEGALDQLIPMGVRRFVAEMWYTGADNWEDEVAEGARFVRGKIDTAFERAGL